MSDIYKNQWLITHLGMYFLNEESQGEKDYFTSRGTTKIRITIE